MELYMSVQTNMCMYTYMYIYVFLDKLAPFPSIGVSYYFEGKETAG